MQAPLFFFKIAFFELIWTKNFSAQLSPSVFKLITPLITPQSRRSPYIQHNLSTEKF
jgi:hypothetical protein